MISDQLEGDEKVTGYDADKREPRFSNADNAQLWELLLLKTHYHPTIRVMAAQLLEQKPITYAGNPLLDFSLVNMLDRFSFKKAKIRKGNGLQKLLDKNRIRRSKIEEPLSMKSLTNNLRNDE